MFRLGQDYFTKLLSLPPFLLSLVGNHSCVMICCETQSRAESAVVTAAMDVVVSHTPVASGSNKFSFSRPTYGTDMHTDVPVPTSHSPGSPLQAISPRDLSPSSISQQLAGLPVSTPSNRALTMSLTRQIGPHSSPSQHPVRITRVCLFYALCSTGGIADRCSSMVAVADYGKLFWC